MEMISEKEQKVSVLNSILAVIFAIIFIGGFWVSRNLEINNLVLLKFYLDEFIFNLRLIFDDIAIIFQQHKMTVLLAFR